MWRSKRPRIANRILKEKDKVEGLTVPDVKTQNKAAVIKTGWYQGKNRQIDQWNRIENPVVDPHKGSQLIFNKGAKMVFSTNCAGTTGHPHAKNECRHGPYIFHKNKLVMDHRSNGKHKTITFL